MPTMPIVFALFPRITQLDFTAPFEAFSRLPNAECIFANVDGADIDLGHGLRLSGLIPLSNVARCDVLCVPGGYGTIEALGNEPFLEHLTRLGRSARYVSSVCTGSLLLAAAGLLEGKRAACHWAWRDCLREFGVTPDPGRVVRDGNVFSGGGVTAGLDLALTLAAELAGQDVAESLQLAMEYAPAPPFDSGRPETARSSVLAAVSQRIEKLAADRGRAVTAAAHRLRQR